MPQDLSLYCNVVGFSIMTFSIILNFVSYGTKTGSWFFVMLLIKKLNVVDCNVVRYNNKTYRVDDFDWDKRPDHSFKLRNDTTITIAEYYKKVSCGATSSISSVYVSLQSGRKISLVQVWSFYYLSNLQSYNIEVKDMNQPLVVSRPKKKDIRMGRTEPIFLLPELCTVTGNVTRHVCVGCYWTGIVMKWIMLSVIQQAMILWVIFSYCKSSTLFPEKKCLAIW